MTYQWFDYQEEHEALVDSWIDSQAAQFTGFEDGFGDYYRYWRNEPQISLGDNFWVKLIAEDGQPVGVIVVSFNDGAYYIAEYLVAPLRRGQGIGSSALAELLACSADILGVEIQDVEACIFPSNVASQKAFERAGFVFDHAHPDGDAWYYRHTKATGDHYVYLLQCADDTLYCGYTTDLDRRLQTHNDGRGAKYTRSRLPVSLVYFEQCASKSEALKREWAIKKLTRDQKLALIGPKGASSINTV